MTHWRLFSTVIVVVAWFSAVITSQAPSGHAVFEQALTKERVDGNLSEAIKLYERVVTDFAADRALASRALMQVGLCYEKLGRDEAVRAYERLVRDFADQAETVAQAKARLTALIKTPAPMTSPARRLVWDGADRVAPPVNPGRLTRDGKKLLRYDDRQRAWELFDPTTNTARQLTSDGPSPQEAMLSPFLNELSPDGRRVAVEVRIPTSRAREFDRFELRVFEAGSRGPGRALATWDGKALFQARPFAWSPRSDRVWLFVMRADQSAQIVSVDMNGKLEVLKTLTWRDLTQPPSLSPDGRFVAYHDTTSREAPNDIYVLATDGSREQRIEHPAEDSKPLFVPDGSGIVFESNRRGYRDLWFQAIADGRPSGEPRLIWRNIGPYGTAERFTDAGSLFYYFLVNEWGTYTAPLDLTAAEPLGEPTRLPPVNNESNSGAAFSPDGRYLAHFRDNAARLVIRELADGFEREIPFGATLSATYAAMDWCPGGEALIAVGYKGGMVAYRVDVKDSSVKRLPIVPAARPAARCVGNGEDVIYTPSTQSGVHTAAVRRSMTSGRETTIYTGDVRSIARSMDGKRLAMVIIDPDGKRARLVTMAADGSDVSADLMSTATVQFFPQDIHRPLMVDVAWMPGGDRLLVVQLEPGGGSTHTVWEVSVDGGPPRKLNPLRLTPVTGRSLGLGSVTIHPGGKLLAFQRHEGIVEQFWAIDNLAQFIKTGGGQ
jgi:WD40-like Beta Propeller Repeat